MKTCTTCKKNKNIKHFYNSMHSQDGFQNRCKDCQNEKSDLNTFKKDHPDMTEVEFLLRYAKQLGRCASCKNHISMRDVHIDHDHAHCGKKRSCVECRRALLCRSCNISLGIMKEDADRIRKLANYADMCAQKVY